ncbi:MAG: hypothetical protein H7Y20_02140 [Bryobacteraceae bacterium]|nr:hypothetical protein [Bryobacteraceae bacterium]
MWMLLLGSLIALFLSSRRPQADANVSLPQRPVNPEKLKFWQVLREMIVHEDNLVNQRLTWLFALHAFIVGGFFVVQAEVVKSRIPAWAATGAEALLFMASAAAYRTCELTRQTICSAYVQIAFVRFAWQLKYPEETWQSHLVNLNDPYNVCESWPKATDENRPAPELPNIAGQFEFQEKGTSQENLKSEDIARHLSWLDKGLMAICVVVALLIHLRPEWIYPTIGEPPRPGIHINIAPSNEND